MTNPAHSAHLRRFDQFELDLRTAEIYKQGKRVKLQDQPCQVLALLTERPGDLVTREELQKKLWPNETFVDFDHGVNVAINKLREALGDSAEHPRFIETLPRRGYRWLAPVECVGDISANRRVAVPKSASREERSSPARVTIEVPASKVRVLPAIATSGMAFLFLLALLFTLDVGKLRTRMLGSAVPVRIQSVAILPLENLSHEPEQEYFADGMTEELIASLAKIGALHVTSRTSVMRYKRTNKSLSQVPPCQHL